MSPVLAILITGEVPVVEEVSQYRCFLWAIVQQLYSDQMACSRASTVSLR